MKILYLNLPFPFPISRDGRWPERAKSGTLYYPFWLAYASGMARKRGHEISLIDAIPRMLTRGQTLARVRDCSPDLLVCEITMSTAREDLKTLDFLRERGYKGPIAVAGPFPSACPESIFEMSSSPDYAIRGEFDLAACLIAEKAGDAGEIPGISYKSAEGEITHNKGACPVEDLDELPYVSGIYSEFLDFSDYCYSLAIKPMVQIFSGRGCPYRCTFCAFPQTSGGRKYRVRSLENFVGELEYINQRLPQINEIFIEDDTFTVDKERISRICDRIMDLKLDITWSANARADVPFEVLEKMKKAGCRLLVAGYESGSQAILDNVRKGITLEQSRAFARNTRRLGIKVFGCFMLGLPGETMDTLRQTYLFAKELDPDMVFFQQAVPFPGTEFYDYCARNAYLVTREPGEWLDAQGYLRSLVSYPGLSAGEIEKARDDFMRNFYFSPSYIIKTLFRNRDVRELSRIMRGALTYIVFRIERLLGRLGRRCGIAMSGAGDVRETGNE